ncbi:MAG TPA: PucR family transcriptional regulator ligand-binding domain-containing protein [Thermoleophilaceae bacterium]|nr:PucR family transcriptional regulator ligand-binding domain-containing protein [Thermoleophilaceae bacterium]
MLTLAGLLGQPDLGLELVTGEGTALSRPLAGAHSMEVGQPLTWLEPDWVMLTVGMRLQKSPKEQRRLIADAADGGLAAIGFGVGIVFDRVPKAMLDEARRRDFPIFTVPEELPFRVIVDTVNQSLLSEHIAVAQRSLSIQRYLMDTLSSPEPRDDLVTRLAQVLQSAVIVFRHDGRVLLRRGALPADEIWTAVCVREPREQDFHLGDLHVRSAPVAISGGPTEWLVVGSPRDHVAPALARDVVRGACKLLAVLGRARRVAVLEERNARAQLLERLAGRDIEAIDIDRLRIFGIGVADGVRAVSLAPPPGVEGQPARLAEVLEGGLARAHVPHLLWPADEDLVLLAEDAGLDVEALLVEAHEAGQPVVASSGRLVNDVDSIAASVHDARVGLAGLLRSGAQAGAAISVEDFDVAEWLVSEANGSAGHRAERALSRLRAHPEMYETLVAYLESDLKVKATARALNLHPNSLRYRLSRIEEILERPLDSVSSIVDLYLALLIEGADSRSPEPPASA